MKVSPKQPDLTMITEIKLMKSEAYFDYMRWIRKGDFKRKIRM